MAQQRLSMRKIREILRLHHEQAGLSRTAGGECRLCVVDRAEVPYAGAKTWPGSIGRCRWNWMMRAVQARLYLPAALVAAYPLPDFAATVHAELARKGVTRGLLWRECKAAHPDGLLYTAFCTAITTGAAGAISDFNQAVCSKVSSSGSVIGLSCIIYQNRYILWS